MTRACGLHLFRGMPHKSKNPAGSERARDEQRDDRGPAYGGKEWEVADERGDKRFGHARVDDANPSELDPAEAATDDGSDLADPEAGKPTTSGAENSGQREGFGRGEKPRKAKSRSK